MKKKVILALFFLCFYSFAQSKKEIIAILNSKIDSFKIEIKNRDIKFDKEVEIFNSNRQNMLFNISKLESELITIKNQQENIKKEYNNLLEENSKLKNNINNLMDSILIIKKENFKLSGVEIATSRPINTIENFNKKVEEVFEKIKNDENSYNRFDRYTVDKDVVKNFFNQICIEDEDECVSFVLTDEYLVMSNRVANLDERTFIINLNTGINILEDKSSFFYVNDYDKQKGLLKVGTTGLDTKGRYWKNGTYDLKNQILQFGKKEY